MPVFSVEVYLLLTTVGPFFESMKSVFLFGAALIPQPDQALKVNRFHRN